MMRSKVISLALVAVLLLGSAAAAAAAAASPHPYSASGDGATAAPVLRIGGWVLVGAGALIVAGGLLLLAEGFTSTDRNTADFGKMMGIGALVAGSASAGLGIIFLTVRLD